MKSIRNIAIAVTLLLTPAAAHAQCGEQPGGLSGLIDSLLDLFRSKKIKFDTAQNGAGESWSGEIEVKSVACGSTTMNVRVAKSVYVKGETGAGPVKVGVDVRAGGAVEYELTLPDKDWANTNAPPNPLDPQSLPKGGTMVLKREYFTSLGMEKQYKEIIGAAGYEEGAGAVVAVTRRPDGQVELSVGPYSVVKRELFLGVGNGDYKIGLGRDEKLENGKLKKFTFDPENADDVAAYRNVFGQGMTRTDGSVLTDRPSSTIEYATYESQFGVRASGGPFSGGGNIINDGADLRFETSPDGRVEGTATSSSNGTTMQQKRVWDAAPPEGKRIGEDEITISFAETDNLYYLAKAVGEEQGPGGFKIKLTEEGWKEWRDRARAYLERNPDKKGTFPLQDIADAQSAMDLAQTLYLIGANPIAGEEMPLLLIAADDGRPLPGGAGKACDNAPEQPEDPETRVTELAKRWCGSNVDLFAPTAAVALPVGIRSNGNAGKAIGAGMARD